VPPTCLLGEQRHIWMGVLFQEHDDGADDDDDNVSSENNDDEISVKFTYSHS